MPRKYIRKNNRSVNESDMKRAIKDYNYITIRNLGELTKKAILRSFTNSNITNAFKKPGLWPVNRLAFSDEDFAPSQVTERPIGEDLAPSQVTEQPIRKDLAPSQVAERPIVEDHPLKRSDLETNHEQKLEVLTSPLKLIIQKPDKATNSSLGEPTPSTSGIVVPQKRKSLEDIRPYPKSIVKRSEKKLRRECKSKIYTSTPILKEIEKAEMEKHRTLALKSSKQAKRKILEDSDTSTSTEVVLAGSSDDDLWEEDFPKIVSIEANSNICKEDFVLVKFCTNFLDRYFIGQVLQVKSNECEVKFLRRKNNSDTFVFPNVDDISNVDKKDIVSILPMPQNSGTVRMSSLFMWKINFQGYSIS